MKFFVTAVLHILLIFALSAPARAATVTWLPTGGTNDWFVGTNWSSSAAPTNGDDVIITNTVAGNNFGVLLTNAVGYFSSILLSNKCTLIFSNWDTSLSATNVTILTNASMTLPAAFTNNAMSNRVWIVCSNLTIISTNGINADGRGYKNGNGPGCAGTIYNGGSYGGRGGYQAAAPYGSAEAPFFPGSGAPASSGGNGGGAVRIEADAVTNNGMISANGNAGGGGNYGGGSGGGIYITCNTFAGTNGIVRANGGYSPGAGGSGGGGGRISVVYNPAAQSNVPSVTFSALLGDMGSGGYGRGDLGTLYFPDNRFLTNSISHSGQWKAPGFTNWAPSELTINGSIGFPGDSFLLNVAGNLTITGATGKLWLGSNVYVSSVYRNATISGPTLQIGGNLVLTNGAQLYIFSGNTNDAMPYGAQVVVTGDVFIASGSSIFPYSHNTNGGSPLFTVWSNLTIAAGGAINANSIGYLYTNGPGRGIYYLRGGGYGGAGGGSGAGGTTYGNSNAPTQPGSGGGDATVGGNGGGLVRIEAQNVRVDGSISANGEGNSTGGSGGGIFIICNRFEGSGTNTANGGTGGGSSRGGGGGGRIAIWFDVRNIGVITQRLRDNPDYTAKQVTSLPLFTGTSSATGGTGLGGNGDNGTVMFIQAPPPGTIFTIH